MILLLVCPLIFDYDEVQYRELTKEYLQIRGFHVMLKHNGVAGLDAFNTAFFDLCVLDVKMPKKDGFTLAQEIRLLNEDIPHTPNFPHRTTPGRK